MAAMTPDKALEAVVSLKRGVLAKKNLFIAELLGIEGERSTPMVET